MRNKIIITALLLTASLMPVASPATSRALRPAPSFCARPEVTLFSCPVGVKTVSVCAHGGQAVYRYGKVPRIEIEGHRLKFAETAFSGGGESQIVFENNGYRYIVYDSTVRTSFGADGKHDPKFMTGLIVQKAGRTISNASCVGTGDSGMSPNASKSMPAGTYVPH